ncbi:PIN domain-like protein [Pisolithus marmoratus]|nr:PIN domain-like protein [Pisolithus marmoratus]
MGVAGLWEVLRPAAEVRSLTELAVSDGFVSNPGGLRGFRIGIDASIWFFHAAYGREGENPELRTLFFRCCRLLRLPLLPLFVFDGPKRPAVKRGKRIGDGAHWLTTGMKNIIQSFGFEWRMAPGEAEAELAYLNSIGVIDAVLSDDVDTFLFGATMVIRNPSSALSGNRSHPTKNSEGRDDGNHVLTYRADSLPTHPSVRITRGGAILIALLSGGDYIPAGLPGCGKAFAVGLAHAGFGDSLVCAATTLKGDRLDDFLSKWRNQLRTELRSNKSGFLPSKRPSLAAYLPDSFPSIPVLLSYVSPLTSQTEQPSHAPSPVLWSSDPDPARIASLCELYFEWGVRDNIMKHFRTVLWQGVMCRALRRRVIDAGVVLGRDPCDQDDTALPQMHPSTSEGDDVPSSRSTPFSLALFHLVPSTSMPSSDPALLMDVLSIREHSSTDGIPEYRVLVDPSALVTHAASGVRGIRPPLDILTASDEDDEEVDEDEAADDDNDGSRRLKTAARSRAEKRTKRTQSAPVSPTASLRLWLPAVMVRAVVPDLVDAYEMKVRRRAG